jgi:hypothetical protein
MLEALFAYGDILVLVHFALMGMKSGRVDSKLAFAGRSVIVVLDLN